MIVTLTHQIGRLKGLDVALVARGHSVQHIPLIRTEVLWDANLESLGNTDWWVFTSISAIEAAAQLRVFNLPLKKIAVLGRASAGALQRLGIEPTLISPVETALGLAKVLLELPKTSVFTWFRGTLSLPDLQNELHKYDRNIQSITIYHTVSSECPVLTTDVLVIASPSAIRSIPESLVQQTQLLALGTSTLAAILARGWTALMVLEPSVEGILSTLEQIKGNV
jgi:uroporphyrinogen-III synthase